MNQKGSILIAGLWAMSLLSIMTASLGFTASQEVLLLKRDISDFNARLDFSSAISQVAVKIDEDPYPHNDSKQDSWFGKIQLDKPFDAKMEVMVEDEESKLNLNQASEALLKIFFKTYEEENEALKGSRKDYVKGIAGLKKGRRIQSLAELMLIDGFEPDDFKKLEPYLTVYPEFPSININTVKPLVLKTFLNYLSGDKGTKEVFLSRIKSYCLSEPQKGADCHFQKQELEPGMFARLLKLPQDPSTIHLTQQLLTYLTTDSENFSVTIRPNGAYECHAVFLYRVGQARPKILYWHEE